MAVINEQTVTGRKFRKLIDEANRLWLRISFWTMACDVEFADGETAETKFANIAKTIDNLTKSFQDGVNRIFNCLKGLGFTPNPNSPDGICSAIQNMYNKRYNDGRTQGQEDVKANPEDFGVSTGISLEQFKMYSSREDFTVNESTCIAPRNGTCKLKFEVFVNYKQSHNANTLTLSVLRNNSATIIYENFDKDISEGGAFIWAQTIDVPNCVKGERLTFQLNHAGSDASWIAGIY